MIGNQIHVPSCLARNFGRTSLRMKKASFHCDRFVKTLAAGMNYDWHYPTMYDFPMFASDLMPLQKIAVQHVFPNSLLCDLVAAFCVTSQSLIISTYFHHQVHRLRLGKACFRLLKKSFALQHFGWLPLHLFQETLHIAIVLECKSEITLLKSRFLYYWRDIEDDH